MNTITTRSGFTLLELMVVVAMMALIAGGAVVLYGSAEEDAAGQIAISEINELKQALLRFKRDTGFLPNQGPFNLNTRPGGAVPPSNLPGWIPAAQLAAWFDSPGNFWQLYANPLAGTGHPLETWSPTRARGWNGPYLGRFGEGLVDIGDNLQQNGSGSPVFGAVLPQVVGIADPMTEAPIGPYLVWRSADGLTPHSRWGRPYLLFDLDNQNLARIVSMGRNRQYEGGGGDDIVLELFQ